MERWSAEVVHDARAHLGEGPLWDERTGELLWVDIMPGIVHRFNPSTRIDRPFETGQPVGCVVTRAAGGYALAVKDGIAVAEDESGVRLLTPVEADRPSNRMNDGACDSCGRFWAGTMSMVDEPAAGALYRLDPPAQVNLVLDGVSISNGIAWSPDDRLMYYVDTPTLRVDVFDYDAATGAISGRRRLVRIEDATVTPDGIVVDAEGCIWVGLWGGWSVRRYAPDGTPLGAVDVPVARVTKAAFGGPNLTDLYITTAAPDEPDPAQPLAGSLFHARPGVRGLPSYPFAGS